MKKYFTKFPDKLAKIIKDQKEHIKNLPAQSKLNVDFKKEKSDDYYVENILFKDLLNSNKEFILYDCNKNLIKYYYYKNAFYNSLAVSIFCNIEPLSFYNLLPVGIIFFSNSYYRAFQKKYVEKVVYNSLDKTFELTFKKYLYPFTYKEKMNYNELIYTDDKELNGVQINFINSNNLKTYFIGFDQGWVDKKFFSYLIKQNITGRMI